MYGRVAVADLGTKSNSASRLWPVITSSTITENWMVSLTRHADKARSV